ncbi:MAG: SLOG family protein [Pseudonocardiaceae bacterium]
MGTSTDGAWPFPIVVHGGARGADRLAGDIARGWGWTPEPHPADWARHGRSAGFRRNAEMVTLGADVCLAFILDASRGASHTAHLADTAGIPTIRYECRSPR